jgi:hypothetical protein
MRKLCLPLTVIAAATALFAIGCEDGPDQTFQPAPPGAASLWNNSNIDAGVAQGFTTFDAGYPTVNALTICDTDFRRQRWAWMLTQPIQPPRKYAGIDLAGDDLWDGLTITAAESKPSSPTSPEGGLCQSVALGFEGACPSGFGNCNGNYWGNNQEVGFSWNTATLNLDQMTLQLGYTGSLATGKYPDNIGESHDYAFAIGDVYRRDGEPFEINWNDPTDRATKITNIFNAMMGTYAAAGGVPFNTGACSDDDTCKNSTGKYLCQCEHTSATSGTCVSPGQCGVADCATDGNCLVEANAGGLNYLGVRPMVVYIVGQAGVPQPQLSTPIEIYNFFNKFEPYANLPQTVTLDAIGPIASGTPLGQNDGGVCNQQIGQTFGYVTNNCVAVTDNATANTVNVNKITHGLIHDQEHWTANTLGINQNFTSATVAANPNIVVLDTDTPQPGDYAQDYYFDLRARGAVSNDTFMFPATSTLVGSSDLRGSSLVFIDWARLMLEDIAKQQTKYYRTTTPLVPRKIGDPDCIGFTGSVPTAELTNAALLPIIQPTDGGVTPPNTPALCSGVEGLIVPGLTEGDFSQDPNLATADPNANLNPSATNFDPGFYGSVLHPGDIVGAVCIDPGAYTDCEAVNSIWTNILTQVIRVEGRGVVTNLPYEMQDRRYYFKTFGFAYVQYLKAYGNYVAKYGFQAANTYPTGTIGGGLGPSDVVTTPIDLEAFFWDYNVSGGNGGAQTFDKFEYVDRTTIGSGAGCATSTLSLGAPTANPDFCYIPWDIEYGSDLQAGNQRYDNWYRRMDREEIGMYSAMLEDKTKTPGAENNVNITNLFGSPLLGGNPLAGVSGAWTQTSTTGTASNFQCATGTGGDPASNGCNTNPPLDPTPSLYTPPSGTGTCTGTNVLITANSYENGVVQGCVPPCNFGTYPATGCAPASATNGWQAGVCVANGTTEGCMPAMMDKNLGNSNAQVLLAHYPGAFARSPYSAGHSGITLQPSDEHPEIGVAHVTVPNYLPYDPTNCPTCNGPYTYSPTPATIEADGGLTCPIGWKIQADNTCHAPTYPSTGTGTTAPYFNPLTPWQTPQPGIGFTIPITGTRSQYVSTGQFDYTGVLESYIVDYLPWVDNFQPSCITSNADSATACNPGFACNPVTAQCEDADNTVRIAAIEGQDFLGQAFLCQDPTTGDVLHMGMYDSALTAVNWLAAHPGSQNEDVANNENAQTACQIVLIRSPQNNYIDYVVSLTNGVLLNISGGQGLGRVTDIVLFDPGLIQAL